MLNLIFCCSSCDYYEGDYVYKIPEPLIEVFEPKGFRVSIPHRIGIGLFAFHANINKELKDIDAGELSKDIVKKTGDRWVYENKIIKLKPGDVINYWLFVIKNNLGYKLDKQSFVVDSKYTITMNLFDLNDRLLDFILLIIHIFFYFKEFTNRFLNQQQLFLKYDRNKFTLFQYTLCHLSDIIQIIIF